MLGRGRRGWKARDLACAALVAGLAATANVGCTLLTSLDGLTGKNPDQSGPRDDGAAPPSAASFDAGRPTIATSDATPDASTASTPAPTDDAGTAAADDASTGDAGGAVDASVPDATAVDLAEYAFENGTQSWGQKSGNATSVSVAQSTAHVFAGSHALAIDLVASAASLQDVGATPPSSLAAGQTVTYHVWIPSGGGIVSVQPYVLQGAAGNYQWTGQYVDGTALASNDWNTITVTVPSNAATPLYQIGVELGLAAGWSGTVWVDSVVW